MTILIAEDEAAIRQGLVDALESEGYSTTACPDGLTARDCAAQSPADLYLLDIMMPGLNGFDLCRELRRTQPHAAIILLTAKGEEIDKVLGLELGADDYITKPFGIRELLARIKAVLRRRTPTTDLPEATGSFRFGLAAIDPARSILTDATGHEHPLTPRELKLIRFFKAKKGQPLSRDALLNEGWGITYYGTTRTLDQHIVTLRKRIEADPAAPVFLLTRYGIGYVYEEPE